MAFNTRCPICGLENCKKENDQRDQASFDCKRCGEFILSGSLEASIQSYLKPIDASLKLSHWLRNRASDQEKLLLDTLNIKPILERDLPSLPEQSDLLLKWLARQSKDFGESVKLYPQLDFVVIGAKSEQSFMFVLDHLKARHMIVECPNIEVHRVGGETPRYSTRDFVLQVDAWTYLEALNRDPRSYHRAFMAMKFGDLKLDKIVAKYFKPAAGEAGFELLRLDDNPSAGLIDNRMRVEIRNADFVIADLTHDNLGAYWEAGYAEGLGKPVIYTCEKAKFEQQKTHFDTNHHLTILWDPEDPNKAAEELKATIRATLPHLAKLQ